MQFDVNRKPWWVLQDAGGDIVALCDNSGSVGGAAFVAAQWTYDACGSVFSADHLSPHPFMHAGHKGLFFDRLDVGVADAAVPGSGGGVGAAGGGESPRLVPFAHSIIHNRNRAYNPQFGRFPCSPNDLARQTRTRAPPADADRPRLTRPSVNRSPALFGGDAVRS